MGSQITLNTLTCPVWFEAPHEISSRFHVTLSIIIKCLLKLLMSPSLIIDITIIIVLLIVIITLITMVLVMQLTSG